MDEIRVSQPKNMPEPVVLQEGPQKPSGKGFWVAITTVIVMVLVAGVIIFTRPNGDTPIATQTNDLENLSKNSLPVTSSVKRQAADLSILASQSQGVTVSREDKLKELESMK